MSEGRRTFLLDRYVNGTMTYAEALELRDELTFKAAELMGTKKVDSAASIFAFLIALAAYMALLPKTTFTVVRRG